MGDHQIPRSFWALAGQFINVSNQPCNAGLIRSEMLHGLLKPEFIKQQSWIPLEETLKIS